MKYNRKINCIVNGKITHTVYYYYSKIIEIKFLFDLPAIDLKNIEFTIFNLGTEETER